LNAEERAKSLREKGWMPPGTDPDYWDVIFTCEFEEVAAQARDEQDREWREAMQASLGGQPSKPFGPDEFEPAMQRCWDRAREQEREALEMLPEPPARLSDNPWQTITPRDKQAYHQAWLDYSAAIRARSHEAEGEEP
jgi:hypothetical protein